MAKDSAKPTTQSAVQARFAGLAAGIIASLLLGALGATAYSGKGLGETHEPPPQVYSNF